VTPPFASTRHREIEAELPDRRRATGRDQHAIVATLDGGAGLVDPRDEDLVPDHLDALDRRLAMEWTPISVNRDATTAETFLVLERQDPRLAIEQLDRGLLECANTSRTRSRRRRRR